MRWYLIDLYERLETFASVYCPFAIENAGLRVLSIIGSYIPMFAYVIATYKLFTERYLLNYIIAFSLLLQSGSLWLLSFIPYDPNDYHEICHERHTSFISDEVAIISLTVLTYAFYTLYLHNERQISFFITAWCLLWLAILLIWTYLAVYFLKLYSMMEIALGLVYGTVWAIPTFITACTYYNFFLIWENPDYSDRTPWSARIFIWIVKMLGLNTTYFSVFPSIAVPFYSRYDDIPLVVEYKHKIPLERDG